MDGIICDRCGVELLVDHDVRYVMRLELFAAYDPMEITRADLARDHAREMRKIIESVKDISARELEDAVHFQVAYDLCPPCRAAILADPLCRQRPPPPATT